MTDTTPATAVPKAAVEIGITDVAEMIAATIEVKDAMRVATELTAAIAVAVTASIEETTADAMMIEEIAVGITAALATTLGTGVIAVTVVAGMTAEIGVTAVTETTTDETVIMIVETATMIETAATIPPPP